MGNNSLNFLTEMYNNFKSSNMHISMGSPDFDFMKYDTMKGFFGYSTAINDPNLSVGGKQLYEILNKNYIFYNGHLVEKMPIEIKNLAHIPLNVEPVDYLLEEGFSKPEIVSEVHEISKKVNKIKSTDLPLGDRSCSDKVTTMENVKRIYHNIMANFYPEFDPKEYLAFFGDIDKMVNYKTMNGLWFTPGFRAKNFLNLMHMLEQLEFYGRLDSHSVTDFFYKLDLRESVLFHDKDFLIQDIENYDHYVTDDYLSPRTKNLKITTVLYKTQQMRELFFSDIIPDLPHYTPEQFIDLCTNAVLNLSYSIFKNDIHGEEYLDALGFNNCYFTKFRSDYKIAYNYGENMPVSLNDQEFSAIRHFPAWGPIFDAQLHNSAEPIRMSAREFIYDCEKIRQMQHFVDNTWKLGPIEKNNFNLALCRSRHASIHRILSDLFIDDLNDMPKKFERANFHYYANDKLKYPLCFR